MRLVPLRNLKLWKARELFLGLNRSPRHGGLLQARVLARSTTIFLFSLDGRLVVVVGGRRGGLGRPVLRVVLLVLPGGGANLVWFFVVGARRPRDGLVGGSGGRHRRRHGVRAVSPPRPAPRPPLFLLNTHPPTHPPPRQPP